MKKLVTKALGVILSAAMIFGSIPVNASPTFAEEVTAETAATNEVSAIDTGNEEKESDNSSSESRYEEPDPAVEKASGEAAGEETDGEPEPDLVAGDNVYPARTKGSFKINAVYSGGSRSGQYDMYTIAISNVDKDVNINTLRNVQAAATYTGNASGSLITGMAHTTTTAHATLYQDAGSTNYNYLYATFQLNIPTGYRIDGVSYSGQGTRGTLHHLYLNNANLQFNTTNKTWNSGTANLLTTDYAQDGTAQAIAIRSMVDIFYNAGVGTTSANYVNAHGNVTQTVTVSPITYKLSYNANGGSGAPAPQTLTYDTAATMASAIPTATGYTFGGWNIGGVTYNAGQALTAAQVSAFSSTQNATVTATAVWTPITYTASYDLDGGTGAASNHSVTYGTNFKLPAAPVKTGYTFAGWKASSNNTTYAAGQTVQAATFSSTQNATVTFKAVWSPITYTVKYMSDDVEVGTQILTYDKEEALKTFKILKEGPARDYFENKTAGYTFEGWTSAVGSYKNGEVVKNLAADNGATVTLNAQWKEKEKNEEVRYRIKHYIQKQPDGEYELFSTTDTTWVEKGTVVTPELSQEAIDFVNAIEGCRCEKPQQITQSVIDDGTVIKYYYKCVKGSVVIDGSGELTDDAINEIAKKLVAGLSFSMQIEGVEYEIIQNPDGTLAIKFATTTSEKVVIPDVIKIGDKVYRITEVYENAFKDNTTLKEVVISQNVSKIGNSAFEGCKNLEKITLMEGLVTIGDKAFKGCSSLTSISMPATLQTIGNNAFENCTKLKTVTLNEGLLKIGSKAFYNCKALTKIKIPKTVLKIGSYAFGKCIKLKTVTFATDSQLLTLGTGVFSECKVLAKIKLPDKLTNVPGKAFYNCKKLAGATIGKSVTKISTAAFRNCSSLKKITIPEKVQTIGKEAFYNCKEMKDVKIKSKALTSVGSKAFKKCKKGLKIVVPGSKTAAYKKLLNGKY